MRSFVRKIHTFDIEPVHLGDERTGAQVYALNIRGTAFLWHQVRGVGRGKEGDEWGSVSCVHFVHVTHGTKLDGAFCSLGGARTGTRTIT